jgi:pimeloyl-ACP methyl ester carboxylesterase
MAHFLLIHGGFSGGWTWNEVVARLRGRGHAVFAPTLTGLGKRAHLARPETDLDTHVQDLVGVVECEEADALLVVASSSGVMAATGFAHRVPERVRALVYLDTLVPEDGQSWMDLLGPAIAAPLRQAAERFGDGWRVPRTDVPPPRWVPQPLRTVTQPVRADHPAAASIPRIFVHCTAKPEGWFFGLGPVIAAQAEHARRAGWVCHELPTDHLPMLSAPALLAA